MSRLPSFSSYLLRTAASRRAFFVQYYPCWTRMLSLPHFRNVSPDGSICQWVLWTIRMFQSDSENWRQYSQIRSSSTAGAHARSSRRFLDGNKRQCSGPAMSSLCVWMMQHPSLAPMASKYVYIILIYRHRCLRLATVPSPIFSTS